MSSESKQLHLLLDKILEEKHAVQISELLDIIKGLQIFQVAKQD